MSPSSEEIVSKSFTNVRRGYSPNEVKAFLEQIASEGVSDRTQPPPPPKKEDVDEAADEIRAVLTAAREAAQKVRGSSEQEATATLEEAKKRAERLVDEAKRYAEEQRAAAKRERDELLDGAAQKFERLRAQEHELQETANRAEKALQDLQAALRSEQSPGPRQQPSVIELDSPLGDVGDRENQIR
jgi:DivIVA domain-containing protein